MTQTKKTAIVPVMFCFFAMGFVDLVGIASNYVKQDLGLSDTVANTLPMLVFLWFLIFSVPTGMLMNKIGRKNTVLLSLVVTVLSLLLPLFGESFALMLVSFSLLGIGNTLMQVSLNPLVGSIVAGNALASTLTFGQFVKAVASFLAPIIASWCAGQVIPDFGFGWRALFLIYFVIGILATFCLYSTKIEEDKATGNSSSVMDCLRLLGEPIVLLSFIGIVSCVGVDVGTNTTAPKILQEKLGLGLDEAAIATSIYFFFRTIGCLTGSFLLRVMRHRTFYLLSMVMLVVSMLGLYFGQSYIVLCVSVALVGFGNSNIFGIILSRALLAMPTKQNEVSGLMIMGLVGGAIFPPVMGLASDAMGQVGAVLVMTVGVIYLCTYTMRVPAEK